MCFGGPSVSAAPPIIQQAAPPPPPPAQAPRAPDLDPQVKNKRETASAQRKGTSIFRNDLTIPTGTSSVGSGINIPR